MKAKQLVRKIVIICIWLGIWEALALAVHSKLIMAGPLETLRALLEMAVTGAFYTSLLFSTCRVLAGFLIALLLAVALAALSYRFTFIREFLHPFFLLARSIPVASFVIIALLWMGSKNLAVFIVVLVALPILYSQLLAALLETDSRLLELAEVFHFRLRTRVCTIYVPAVREQFLAACRLAVGMSFKAGIAAEIIAGTRGSIGERLYMAKLYFATGELFAWTAVIVILSWCCERLAVLLYRLIFDFLSGETQEQKYRRKPFPVQKGDRVPERAEPSAALDLSHVNKRFGESEVLRDITLHVKAPELAAISGPSGAGKTTLLRIIAGLEKPDGGEVRAPERRSVVFQDTRLFENLSAVSNVAWVMKKGAYQSTSRGAAVRALKALLPEECLGKPVKNLSGGERRRVELARAMLADSQMVLLDEPFSGMDEETRARAAAFVRAYGRGRMIIVCAHEPEELGGLVPEQTLILKAGTV